jgi:hypothetical protein
VYKRQIHKTGKSDQLEKTSGGVMLEIDDLEANRDDLDDEFERY